MVSKCRPYVGVSGVSSVEDAKKVLFLMHESGFTMQTRHVPMMGFQVSWKSLDFGFSEGNNRVPRLNSLPLILEAVSGEVFPTIHYYTKRPDRLVQEIERVLEYNSIYDSGLVGGLQINGAFPEPESVEWLKNSYPSLKLALQVNPDTKEIEAMAKTIARYYKGLDYVLLDSSGGRGLELDTKSIAATYRALRDNGSEAGMVFAGGLTGENIANKIRLLAGATGVTEFSIDAEGGLRNRLGEGYGNDLLDLAKVASYLGGAYKALLVKNEVRSE